MTSKLSMAEATGIPVENHRLTLLKSLGAFSHDSRQMRETAIDQIIFLISAQSGPPLKQLVVLFRAYMYSMHSTRPLGYWGPGTRFQFMQHLVPVYMGKIRFTL